jgi:hypothetical protein
MKKELYIKLVIYKNCTKMHSQQNIKLCNLYVSEYEHKMQFPGTVEYQNEKLTFSLLCNFEDLW